MKYVTLLLISGILLSSCVNDPQDIPPGLTSNPVFFADINIGQTALHLSAGENGYAMKTEHFVDDAGVTHYVATLAAEVCPDAGCPEFEIEFFDNQVISHPESGAENTFQPGIKEFYNAEEDGFLEITFFLAQDSFGPGIAYWTTAGDSIPVTSSELQLMAKPDAYIDLCFHRLGNAECQGGTDYCFHTLASSPFIGLLKAELTYDDQLRVEMDLQGEAPFTFSWMNGATTASILLPAHEGVETEIGIVVTDATHSQIEVNQTILVEKGEVKMCGGSPQFVYSIADAPFTQFSTAIVRYIDENGMVYSSALGSQAQSLFEILSVSDYGDSPQGFETKEVELSIAATLYSQDGSQSVSLTTQNMVVAVSYEK